jgi:hypothetical protein
MTDTLLIALAACEVMSAGAALVAFVIYRIGG